MIHPPSFPMRPGAVRRRLGAGTAIELPRRLRAKETSSAGRSWSVIRALAVTALLGGGLNPVRAQPDADPVASQPSATATKPAAQAQPASVPSAATQSPPNPTSSAPAAQDTTAVPTATPPRDFSPWAMFRNADVVVKAVMIGLASASLVTWTIFFAKRVQLSTARFRAVRAVREVLRAASLQDLDQARRSGPLKAGPVAALVHAAANERERSANLPAEGIKERAAIALGRIEARAARTVTRGTGLVASVGSTAPFVGLFGTVWGIMNAFVGISQAHTTNLAVVAPGIAEALLATAVGLVAAIPAVIIYNGLARAIAGYRAVLSDASAEIMRHLSRDLDRQFGPAE